jgi:hypothetical protein
MKSMSLSDIIHVLSARALVAALMVICAEQLVKGMGPKSAKRLDPGGRATEHSTHDHVCRTLR